MVAARSSGPSKPNRRSTQASPSQPATERPDRAVIGGRAGGPADGHDEPDDGADDADTTGGSVLDRRQAVALAGHTGDEAAARAGRSDPSGVVRATALGALDRLGILTDDDVVAALDDDEPAVRRRASELAAGRPAIDLVATLDDPDPTVVEMAAWALGEQGHRSAVAALVTLADAGVGHRDPLCREAAVAALGAIGDPGGLPAVLGALDDKPAIRRRAAVALAAFEGPEVDAALHRCLDDRDWQVRQVAEDLLAID